MTALQGMQTHHQAAKPSQCTCKPARARFVVVRSRKASVNLSSKQERSFHVLKSQAGVSSCADEGQGEYGRGLVLSQDIADNDVVSRIPFQNLLMVSDDPIDSISIFGVILMRHWTDAMNTSSFAVHRQSGCGPDLYTSPSRGCSGLRSHARVRWESSE